MDCTEIELKQKKKYIAEKTECRLNVSDIFKLFSTENVSWNLPNDTHTPTSVLLIVCVCVFGP